jgi:membrane-associated phospholipid phosphatase
MRTFRIGTLVVTAALAAPFSAEAQNTAPELRTSYALDGGIVLGALAVTAAARLLPVDTAIRWDRELVPFDEPVKAHFSAAAAHASDVLVTATTLAPLALHAGQGWNAASASRALVYGETIAASLALSSIAKYAVRRPRPYVYNRDPQVEAYARRAKKDSHLSFYSGHAATAFAAAVSSGYLFAQSSDEPAARTAVWASGLFLAGATSNLRVRAGKHFYSDVLLGAAAGAALGLAVPALHHHGGPTHALAPAEWVAIATAPVAGALVSQLLPLPSDVTVPLGAGASATLVPWVSGQAAGAIVAGRF